MADQWYTYIVRCADNTLYTGITTDVERRLKEHNSDKKGARYTRGRRPVALVHCEMFSSRAEASRREAAIKKMKAERKRHV
jgi:putative endonuclease